MSTRIMSTQARSRGHAACSLDRCSPGRWLLSAMLVGLLLPLLAGCGSSAPKSTGSAPAAGTGQAIKVLATYVPGGAERPEDVTALCLTDSGLFVGTRKGVRVVAYDAAGKTLAPTAEVASPTKPESCEVNNIRVDGKQVLVASSDGIMTYDGKGWSSESLGPVADVIRYDGTLWIARARGVERQEHGKDWKEQTLPYVKLNPSLTSHVTALAKTPDNRLWFGSEFGIYSYFAPEKKWGTQFYGAYQNIMNDMITNEKGNSDLCGNQVNRLGVDAESGKLLIGTSSGLSLFDGKEAWRTYQGDYELLSSEGGTRTRVKQKGNVELPSPNVTDALLMGGVAWIATAEGLTRVEGDKAQLYDIEHGLPSSYIRRIAYDATKSVMYVATEKGVAVLGPVVAPPPAEPAK